MKAMPNKNSNLHRGTRAFFYATVCAFVFFCIAGPVLAAFEEAPTGDSWIEPLLIYGLPTILVVFLISLVLYRRKSKTQKDIPGARTRTSSDSPGTRQRASSDTLAAKQRTSSAQPLEAPVASTPPKSAPAESERQLRASASHWDGVTTEYEHAAFGAYRIDQEVGKLVLGKPHRTDVISSRVPDDRRAIEASLIKALNAPEADDEGRQRARQALEEYGFVARQSAVLLQGRDAWERSSAARVLGQIGSLVSLPALIEALHDTDSVVRNQAVASLGQLKQPAAIGALLDIARRYSDIPPYLLSESLSACSVDSLGYLDSSSFDLNEAHASPTGESQGRQPSSSFEDLPMGDENDAWLALLTKLESQDARERAQVVHELGMHKAQQSVSALWETALHDSDSSVRSAAVTALGAINHESVFAPVLIALADETREVRAAAARTLSSLHFDRAEAYARVMETADQKTLQEVAQTCLKAGIVSQAGDRLASEDRRQAHEAFSLFSLLAKAGETQAIFDVIENHKTEQVRLCAVRVLSVTARPDAAPKLRELVAVDGMPENVRTSILEVLYNLDKQPAPV